MKIDLWNKLIGNFAVEGMAKRLESVGTGHYQLTIGQTSGYAYAMDRIGPHHDEMWECSSVCTDYECASTDYPSSPQAEDSKNKKYDI